MEHENSRLDSKQPGDGRESGRKAAAEKWGKLQKRVEKKKTAVKTKQNMMDWYGLLVYVEGQKVQA